MNSKDLLMQTDLDFLPRKARILIYGTGSAGATLLAWITKCRPDIRIMGFLDSFKQGTFHDLPVTRFPHLPATAFDQILIASHRHREVAQQLTSAAVGPFSAVATPSYLMANILVDTNEERTQFMRRLAQIEAGGNHLLFFGEYGGKFVGNNKYFFLYAKERWPQRVFWVAEQPEEVDFLEENRIPFIHTNQPDFLARLAQASHFFFDNMTWQRSHPWLRFMPAKKIHMSHGVGLKLTEAMMVPQAFMQALNDEERQRFFAAIMDNDFLLSTSPFYAKEVSQPAYTTPEERISLAGYPKNDLFYRDIPGEQLYSDTSVLKHIAEARGQGKKIVFYTPTFRDLDADFNLKNGLDLNHISHLFTRLNAVLVTKGHSNSTGDGQSGKFGFSNIFAYKNKCDVYPALKFADLLITDYSSIFVDFLHSGKPVLFFPYDWHEYTDLHRQLQFDYEAMTPGPKAYTKAELDHWLIHFLEKGQDGYAEARQRMLAKAFTHRDGQAAERVYQDIDLIAGWS